MGVKYTFVCFQHKQTKGKKLQQRTIEAMLEEYYALSFLHV